MKINKELMKGSTTILILQTLADGERYGYEIVKTIEKSSNGVFSLNEGTLYPILHKLESEDYVVSSWQVVDGRKRKYYTLTKDGKTLLEEKKKEWNIFKIAVDVSLGGNLT